MRGTRIGRWLDSRKAASEPLLQQEVTVTADQPPLYSSAHQRHMGTNNGRAKIKVEVVPILYNNETPASVISKGLLALSHAMSTLNKHEPPLATKAGAGGGKVYQPRVQEIAAVILTVVHIMASVPDKSKPKAIRDRHAYATKTAVAAYLTARRYLVDYVSDKRTLLAVLVEIFSAYIHFGMAVLAVPNRQPSDLFLAIQAAVLESRHYTEPLSSEAANRMGRDIAYHGNLSTQVVGRSSPKYHRPPLSTLLEASSGEGPPHIFVSPLSSRQLARIGRGLAIRSTITSDTIPYDEPGVDVVAGTARYLEERLFPPKGPCFDCRYTNAPFCLCNLPRISRIGLLLSHNIRTIPRI